MKVYVFCLASLKLSDRVSRPLRVGDGRLLAGRPLFETGRCLWISSQGVFQTEHKPGNQSRHHRHSWVDQTPLSRQGNVFPSFSTSSKPSFSRAKSNVFRIEGKTAISHLCSMTSWSCAPPPKCSDLTRRGGWLDPRALRAALQGPGVQRLQPAALAAHQFQRLRPSVQSQPGPLWGRYSCHIKMCGSKKLVGQGSHWTEFNQKPIHCFVHKLAEILVLCLAQLPPPPSLSWHRGCNHIFFFFCSIQSIF